jgi:hypothetical protein
MKNVPLLLASLLAIASPLAAQTIVNLTPMADTHVREASVNNNYGTTNAISIRGTASGNNRYAYLQFDVSSVTEPITGATLTLTLSLSIDANRTSASELELYGLTYATSSEALALGLESTLTNNNAPWPAVRPNNFQPPANATPLLGTVALPASGDTGSAVGSSFTFSNTPALVSLLESARTGSNSIVTLVLIERVGQGAEVNFASREHTTYAAPLLTITAGASNIPEPSAAATLGGLAALAVVASRRGPRHD